jgi:hypothetical protein
MPYGSMGSDRVKTMMNKSTRKKVLVRLRRIAGQVEGIARMVDEGRYCVDVLLQIGAAKPLSAKRESSCFVLTSRRRSPKRSLPGRSWSERRSSTSSWRFFPATAASEGDSRSSG